MADIVKGNVWNHSEKNTNNLPSALEEQANQHDDIHNAKNDATADIQTINDEVSNESSKDSNTIEIIINEDDDDDDEDDQEEEEDDHINGDDDNHDSGNDAKGCDADSVIKARNIDVVEQSCKTSNGIIANDHDQEKISKSSPHKLSENSPKTSEIKSDEVDDNVVDEITNDLKSETKESTNSIDDKKSNEENHQTCGSDCGADLDSEVSSDQKNICPRRLTYSEVARLSKQKQEEEAPVSKISESIHKESTSNLTPLRALARDYHPRYLLLTDNA